MPTQFALFLGAASVSAQDRIGGGSGSLTNAATNLADPCWRQNLATMSNCHRRILARPVAETASNTHL